MLSNPAADQPSQEDCAKTVSFLCAFVQKLLALSHKPRLDQASAKKSMFEKQPLVLSPKVSKLCKVEAPCIDDQFVYRFAIWRPSIGSGSRFDQLHTWYPLTLVHPGRMVFRTLYFLYIRYISFLIIIREVAYELSLYLPLKLPITNSRPVHSGQARHSRYGAA